MTALADEVSFSEFRRELLMAAEGVKDLPRATQDGRIGMTPVLFVAQAVGMDSDYATGTGAHPGIPRLKRVTHLSRDTIVQALHVLERFGWLIVTARGGPGGKATTYRLGIGHFDVEADVTVGAVDEQVEEVLVLADGRRVPSSPAWIQARRDVAAGAASGPKVSIFNKPSPGFGQ